VEVSGDRVTPTVAGASAPALAALIGLLSDPPDLTVISDRVTWDLIEVHAGVYGVSALVAFAARPFVSGKQRAFCDAVLTRNWRKHDQTLLHLQRILGLLEEAGIRALVLKGPLLARRHYQPAFVRKASVDVDLAVRESDIQGACTALAEAGYVQGESLREARAHSYDVHLLHSSLPRIELHFRLSHGATGMRVDECFERADTVNLPNGMKAYVLGPADEMLHLILHFAHHRFPMLFNLYEIRRIWNRAPAEVRNDVIREAIKYHFVGALVMTDIAFRATWGEGFLPAGISLPRTWLQWRLNDNLYRQCSEWSAPGIQLTLATRIRGRWLDFQLTDTPSDALRFLAMVANVARFRLFRGGWRTMQFGSVAQRYRREATHSRNILQ
jgi:hypothetical protein